MLFRAAPIPQKNILALAADRYGHAFSFFTVLPTCGEIVLVAKRCPFNARGPRRTVRAMTSHFLGQRNDFARIAVHVDQTEGGEAEQQ
jgi:hypothetical protein